MITGVLTLAALPAAAQGRAVGKPAGVGKPAAAGAHAPKGPKPTDATHGKSGDTKQHGKSADAHDRSADHASNANRGKDGDSEAHESAQSDRHGRGQLSLADRIKLNDNLRTRVEGVLAGSNLTLDQAADGFRNQGQFIAAINAAKNNSISFASLRTEMVTNHLSLDDAVKKLKPTTTASTTTTTAITATP
jgi:hypothetical protein